MHAVLLLVFFSNQIIMPNSIQFVQITSLILKENQFCQNALQMFYNKTPHAR